MKWTRRKFIRNISLYGIGLALLDAFWFERYFIETKEFFVGKATADNYNFKIVQLSDLHIKSLNRQLRTIAEKINGQKPDLIVITGDAVDSNEKLDVLDEFLQLLDPDIKKIAITGNWEYWGHVDVAALQKVYEANNCELLINQTKQLSFGGKTIAISGVDDFVGGNADIDKAVEGFQQSDHHIILNHCPEYSDTIYETLKSKIAYDCILSGHTHGGQVTLLVLLFLSPRAAENIYVAGITM